MEPAQPIGRLQWLGGLIGAATLAALGAALPGTLRAAAEGEGLFASWALLAGAWMVPTLVLVPVFRAARAGVRGLAVDGGRERIAAAAVWFGGVIALLATLGAFLRRTTHHHALAGVTFAIGSVVLAVLLALFAARAASWAQRARAAGRGGTGLAVLLALASVEGLVIARLVPASLASDARAVAVDGAVATLSLTLATARWIETRRPIALLAPPLGVACLMVALRSNPPAWVGHAPLVGAAARTLGVWAGSEKTPPALR